MSDDDDAGVDDDDDGDDVDDDDDGNAGDDVGNAFKVRTRNSTILGFARVWETTNCAKKCTELIPSSFKWRISVMLM